ncbi:GNAT family N-acetyltransferase [Candidatus Nomurabacteria bacterium]|nr:GNAT family N-acetyltransferase [Candidatus Nomurabacteria bacterium]
MIEIIKLHPDQWELFKDIRLKSLQVEPIAFGSSYELEKERSEEQWRQSLEKNWLEETSWQYFAMEGEKVVGFMGAYIDALPRLRHVAHLKAVFVETEYRGKGISKRLFEFLTDKLKEAGVLKLQLLVNKENERAVAFYKKLGFSVLCTLEKEMLIDGKFYDDYFMEMFL